MRAEQTQQCTPPEGLSCASALEEERLMCLAGPGQWYGAAFEYGANFTSYTLLSPELKEMVLKYTKVPQYLLKGGFVVLVFLKQKSCLIVLA